jgi:DNA-binding transcriptional LysR family regulator
VERKEDEGRCARRPAGYAAPALHRNRPRRTRDRSASVTLAALAATPLVEREEGSGTRRSFTDALADRGTPLITDQRWTIRDTNEGVLAAVAAGEGVGVVSSWALARHARDDVHEARLEGDPVERCLYLVLRRDDDLGPAAGAFVALAHEQAA